MTEIQYPYALLLLFLIPAIIHLKRRYRSKTGFSGVSFLSRELEPGFVKKYGTTFSGIMFMIFSVLALANIRYSVFFEKTYLESKWIMIVQDLSGSMNRPGDESGELTLGDISLEGVKAFIDMRHKDDLIGLIAFSSYAKLISPPTFDKAILRQKLNLLNRKSDAIIFRELTAGGATNASYAAWLALCAFFMLLPQEDQLSFEELRDFRHSLLGETVRNIAIPDKLKKIKFGHGMAIVLFTDGRIEAGRGEQDVRKGLPNFVNVVKLIQKLGIRFYLIVVSGGVSPGVRDAIESQGADHSPGRIFYMPRKFHPERIKAVYKSIHEMEKNRLLSKIFEKKRETRRMFGCIAMAFLMLHCFLRVTFFRV